MQKQFCIITEGAVSRERALTLAKACDLCVSPALLENYSCALLECQLLGLPVVTFAVGGNSEIVKHSVSGWVVELPDIDEMVLRATDLLRDADLLMSMSHAAVQHAANLSDKRTILADWEAVFDDLSARTGLSGKRR